MTQRLYYEDSFTREFTATVLGCTPAEDGAYLVELDRTAFFPEGGGQYADTGFIGEARVSNVQEQEGQILHRADEALEVGSSVKCAIDWDARFRKMQCHTGEHIISGLVHAKYGYDNVGFHLGDDYVTLDFNGELTRAELNEIEDRAAAVVAADLPVETSFPSPEELPDLEYRSKLDLTENVRIVTIPGVDACACCAPHVRTTGQVGTIKILDFAKHKKGVRLFLTAGIRGLEDYRARYDHTAEISGMLAVPQSDIVAGVRRLMEDNAALRRQLNEERTKAALRQLESADITPGPSGNAVFFTEGLDYPAMITIADAGKSRVPGAFAVFSLGADGKYKYVISSDRINLPPLARQINAAINGRGGGKPQMIQGMASGTQQEIEEYFGQTVL